MGIPYFMEEECGYLWPDTKKLLISTETMNAIKALPA